MADYAVYKGDEFICLGTAEQCAKIMGVRPDTVKWYTSPTYQRRLEKRKDYNMATIVIKLEGEE